jgi:hypothetical protein
MSLNARQQFFFQPSPALPEPLNLRLKSREPLDLRLESIEEFDDLAVLLTKRIEPASVATNRRTVASSSENLANNDRMRSTTRLASIFKV